MGRRSAGPVSTAAARLALRPLRSPDWRAPALRHRAASPAARSGLMIRPAPGGPWGWGLEDDGDWSSISGSAVFLGACSPARPGMTGLPPPEDAVSDAFDQVLPCVTGGAAFGTSRRACPPRRLPPPTRAGPVGGGIEYAFTPNWSTKIEDLLYVDLGRVDCGSACNALAPTRVNVTSNVVRAGLN